MKRIISIFIALTAISASCIAQTEKGKILLGGSVNFSTAKSDVEITRTDLGINPTIGFFIADNLVIGTGVGYSHSSYSQNNIIDGSLAVYKIKTNGAIVNPFGRYYVGLTPEIKFFGHLEAAVNWQKTKTDVPNNTNDLWDQKITLYTGSLSPGFAIFPSKKIGIELSFAGFQFFKRTSKIKDVQVSEDKIYNFGASFFNPRLGIQFYL